MNTLTAFSKKISETNGHLGKMYESNPHEDIKKLRERFARDGYLFLKKLLLKDDVIAFREFHDDTIKKKFNDPTINVDIDERKFKKFLKQS